MYKKDENIQNMKHYIRVEGKFVPVVSPKMESRNLVMTTHISARWRHNLEEVLDSLNLLYSITSNINTNINRFSEENSISI
jgi:hypothetical protein